MAMMPLHVRFSVFCAVKVCVMRLRLTLIISVAPLPGTLVGGNMAVLGGLIGTRYDIFSSPDPVIFIEDIAEPIYKVERLLYQLRFAGVLSRAKGIIVGQFTEYRPDRNYTAMYDMIRDMTRGLGIPVAFDFPIGHVDGNMPVIESAPCCLSVTDEGVTFTQTR